MRHWREPARRVRVLSVCLRFAGAALPSASAPERISRVTRLLTLGGLALLTLAPLPVPAHAAPQGKAAKALACRSDDGGRTSNDRYHSRRGRANGRERGGYSDRYGNGRYNDRNRGRYDDQYSSRSGDRYEPRYDSRYDDRYADNNYDPYDRRDTRSGSRMKVADVLQQVLNGGLNSRINGGQGKIRLPRNLPVDQILRRK